MATVDKPVNMDPGYAQLYSSLQVYQNVYNKLVYVDEAGQFIPGLAKSWKQENDRTWLFDLVDNAVFHNGEPLTAKDVVFTFTRLLDPKNKLPMRIFFTPVEGVEAVGPAPGALHAVQAVRAAAGHALAGHRDREREGARRARTRSSSRSAPDRTSSSSG